jgi:hypothetical protein
MHDRRYCRQKTALIASGADGNLRQTPSAATPTRHGVLGGFSMGSIAFALPLKAGMKDKGYKFVEELTSQHSASHHAGAKGLELKRVKVYAQHAPSEMVIIYIESDDLGKTLSKSAETEFERWFHDTIETLTGHKPNFHGGKAPAELLVDWHETHGHAAKGREHAHA